MRLHASGLLTHLPIKRLYLLRLLYLSLVLATSAAMTGRLWIILRVDGPTGLEQLVLVLFAVLSTWVASSFWLVCCGAWVRWFAPGSGVRLRPAKPLRDGNTARVAIVMPIYNEDIARCAAGIQSIRESVQRCGGGARFAYFLLSDSTDPACCRAEEQAWLQLRGAVAADSPIYYRHRARNVARKSGNVADFCRNWGSEFTYMVVLDADSLMTGETLLELTRLMESNPRAGLIQVAARLVGRDTMFARIQQFASNVYGPVSVAGLAALTGPDGNYWGHNAILRVRAFMEHCGLPELPGRAPLGGEILSHDFVEAALLRRAGWEVWMATELQGSYEEVPPTVVDYLKRDRRWCQGNLQHIRLIFARGFRLSSRLHFASGAMAYLASPLWLTLLIVSFVDATWQAGAASTVTYIGRYPVLPWQMSHTLAFLSLLGLSMGMLFGQKLIGLIDALRFPGGAGAFGGRLRLALSATLETGYSALLAPVFMLTHSWFVLQVLFGWSAGWGSQQRTERKLALGSAASVFAPHTALAGTSAMVVYHFAPNALYWFLPLLLGLALAIPLATVTSSARLGLAARARRLFLIPSETQGLPVQDRMRELLKLTAVSSRR